jgi:hypothetical protein
VVRKHPLIAFFVLAYLLSAPRHARVLSIVYGAAALVVAIFALRSKSLQVPARDSEMPIQANGV